MSESDKDAKLRKNMKKYSKYMPQRNTLTNFPFEPFDVFMSDDFEWKPMKEDKENSQ